MLALEITTNCFGCVNACKCCPQDTLVKAYHGTPQLSLKDFDVILNNVPPEVRLEFCGFSEPFLNPRCSQLMLMAAERGWKIRLLSTLTGFSRGDIPILKQCPFHYIRLHVPDTHYWTTNECEWIDQHKLFYHAKLPADYDHLTMGEMSPGIARYLKEAGVPEVITMNYVTRCGTVEEVPTKTGELYCHRERFHRNTLMPDGSVYLCSMDYGLKHYLGNLIEQPYHDIWAAAEKLMIAPHDQMICARCEWASPGHWYHPFGRPKL